MRGTRPSPPNHSDQARSDQAFECGQHGLAALRAAAVINHRAIGVADTMRELGEGYEVRSLTVAPGTPQDIEKDILLDEAQGTLVAQVI
jgi:hypothetical protein